MRTLGTAILLTLALAPVAIAKKPLAAVIKAKVADGNYVGARGDGETVDWTFCKNGKWATHTGGGLSDGRSWKIVSPTGNKKNFTAIIESGSFSVAIARKNGKWQAGISFGSDPMYGAVKRTDAAAACKKL